MAKKRFGLFLMVLVIMAMSTVTFAQEQVEPPSIEIETTGVSLSVPIITELKMAEGLTIPFVGFSLIAKKMTADAPDATIQDIIYKPTDDKGTPINGKHIISKKTAITFGEFPHAGEYIYTIYEEPKSLYGITYSKEKYTLRVQVANKETGGLYVKSITAKKGTDNGVGENKVSEIIFTNIYKNWTEFFVKKSTTGELADKSKKFEFTIIFEKSATEDVLKDFEGSLDRRDGTREKVVSSDGRVKFMLADGEDLSFSMIPVGTKYKVIEKGVKDGYTAYVKVTNNGVEGEVIKGTDENDLVTSENGNYMGKNTNKVEFENKYNEVPITGILQSNFPFILMIATTVLMFTTLIVIKKCKYKE